MLKYPCLVLDHDDTVVQSEATVNYPFFCQILDTLRPGATITAKEYMDGCYRLGFVEMCRQIYHFTDRELEIEHAGWKAYVKEHIPQPYPGIRQLLQRYRDAGGLICVVSQSLSENIIRDYSHHFGFQPDMIFGWELPPEHRKPDPYPLWQIQSRYHLSPAQLLVVDDMKPGWEMANAAGVKIAFAGWGRQDSPQICAQMKALCDHSFMTVDSLTNFLFD